MNAKRIWLVLCCAAVVGCHRGIDVGVLERELRHQEDRIYDLEDCLDQYHALLESCRRENRSLKCELGMPSDTDGDDGRFDGEDGEPLLEPPRIEFDDGSDVDLGDYQTPGEPADIVPTGVLADASPELAVSQGPIAKIEFNPLLSGALDADGLPGDEGVLAVIEPRGAEGELLRIPGEVSLMVRDASKTGLESHLVRWDFDREEIGAYWRKSPLAEGYVFELPWPADVPSGHELQLWARLVTDDGQKFLTRRNIRVEPGGATEPPIGQFQRVSGWTERAEGSPHNLAPIAEPIETLPNPGALVPPRELPRLEPAPSVSRDDSDPVEVSEEPIEADANTDDAEAAPAARLAENPKKKKKDANKPVKRPEWSPDR